MGDTHGSGYEDYCLPWCDPRSLVQHHQSFRGVHCLNIQLDVADKSKFFITSWQITRCHIQEDSNVFVNLIRIIVSFPCNLHCGEYSPTLNFRSEEFHLNFSSNSNEMIYYIVTCWVYDTRQVSSRRIQYSEFIAHPLLHLYNSQLHNYCHLQYHSYYSCWSLPSTRYNSGLQLTPANAAF
jgi:hypothetical protein